MLYFYMAPTGEHYYKGKEVTSWEDLEAFLQHHEQAFTVYTCYNTFAAIVLSQLANTER